MLTPLRPIIEVTSKKGRRLCVRESGKLRDGFPVFMHHGTPGSSIGPTPRGMCLWLLGVWLITYDRPGYGQSERYLGRRVADAAEDVEAIADRLGINEFAVVGRSGGGPHALATAAKYSRNTKRQWQDPEYRAAITGREFSQEERDKKSASMKKRWAEPERSERHIAAIRRAAEFRRSTPKEPKEPVMCSCGAGPFKGDVGVNVHQSRMECGGIAMPFGGC